MPPVSPLEEHLVAIRKDLAAGKTLVAIAAEYGVHKETVKRFARRYGLVRNAMQRTVLSRIVYMQGRRKGA